MTHAIDTVFIDTILIPLLRKLGLPETLPLAKFSPRMQKWVLGEAASKPHKEKVSRRTRGKFPDAFSLEVPRASGFSVSIRRMLCDH